MIRPTRALATPRDLGRVSVDSPGCHEILHAKERYMGVHGYSLLVGVKVLSRSSPQLNKASEAVLAPPNSILTIILERLAKACLRRRQRKC